MELAAAGGRSEGETCGVAEVWGAGTLQEVVGAGGELGRGRGLGLGLGWWVVRILG